MLSQAASLSSQPSLPSLPSLGARDTNVSPSLHQCVAALRGHSTAYVSALALDGDSLYSASSDGRIMVWTLEEEASRRVGNQEEDNEICGAAFVVVATSESSVKCILATGDGTVLSSHQDGKIRAWRVGSRKDGTRRLVLTAVLPTVCDRLRTCLLPWSYVEVRRHRRRTWVHHVDAVTALAVSPNGALLYSSSWDRSLKVWRLPDFRCLESVPAAHDDAINALVASPDGHVYTGFADKKIKAWRRSLERKNKHVLVGTFERHRSAVNALALGGNGKVLYSGACDRSVVVWELGAGGSLEATVTLRGHVKAILCLAAAGDVVCSGSADGTVRVWRSAENISGYTCLAVLEGHGVAVKSLALVLRSVEESSSGGGGGGGSALVCSGALDGEVKVWTVLVPCYLER
jgi:WD40 repeat protein